MAATAYFVQVGLQKIVVDGGRTFRVQPDGPPVISTHKGTYTGTPHGALTYSVNPTPNLKITLGPGSPGQGEFVSSPPGPAAVAPEQGKGKFE